MRQGGALGWVSCNGLPGLRAIFPPAITMLLGMPSLWAQPGQGLLTVIFQLSPSPRLLSHRLSDRFRLCGTLPPSSPHPAPIDRLFLYSICLWHQNDRQRDEGGRHRWPKLENLTESGRWGDSHRWHKDGNGVAHRGSILYVPSLDHEDWWQALCPFIASQCPQDLAQCPLNRWIIPARWINQVQVYTASCCGRQQGLRS